MQNYVHADNVTSCPRYDIIIIVRWGDKHNARPIDTSRAAVTVVPRPPECRTQWDTTSILLLL